MQESVSQYIKNHFMGLYPVLDPDEASAIAKDIQVLCLNQPTEPIDLKTNKELDDRVFNAVEATIFRYMEDFGADEIVGSINRSSGYVLHRTELKEISAGLQAFSIAGVSPSAARICGVVLFVEDSTLEIVFPRQKLLVQPKTGYALVFPTGWVYRPIFQAPAQIESEQSCHLITTFIGFQ